MEAGWCILTTCPMNVGGSNPWQTDFSLRLLIGGKQSGR